MEYVTESLTVSGKWCTIFADKRKVNFGRREDYSPLTWLALRAVANATFSRCARVEPLTPGGSHPRGFQMQKTLLVEQGFEFGR